MLFAGYARASPCRRKRPGLVRAVDRDATAAPLQRASLDSDRDIDPTVGLADGNRVRARPGRDFLQEPVVPGVDHRQDGTVRIAVEGAVVVADLVVGGRFVRPADASN